MTDPIITLALSGTALAGLAMASLFLLKGWSGWLELRRLEISGRPQDFNGGPSPTSRIELADLKERVRKLESIAAGVDL